VPTYLADTSAWHRGPKSPRWETMIEEGDVLLCAPVALELLWSARGPADYRRLAAYLTAGFRHLPVDRRAERLAMRVQATLAARSQHRGPRPVDLLIAAIAELHRVTLLYYDRHFDAIRRVTGQPMEWIAPRGSLD